jgi:hypothetical protein
MMHFLTPIFALKTIFFDLPFFFCSETLPNKLLNILRLHFIMNFKNMPKATLVECWHSAVPLKPSHGQTNCLAKKNLPGGKLGILSFPRKNTQKKNVILLFVSAFTTLSYCWHARTYMQGMPAFFWSKYLNFH